MKKLTAGEIYNKTYSGNTEIQNSITQQLSQGIGTIAPEHIEAALVNLRNRSKNSYYPLLTDALSLYEQRGLIRLYNLSSSNGGRSKVPTTMPLMPGYAYNKYKEQKELVMFVNMYRIGHWSADEKTYDGVNALTDLYSCLESGVIGYKLIIQYMAEKVFNDKNVIEYLTRIYTYMFSLAIQKTKTSYGSVDFQSDAASFLIARFFLLNILEKRDSEIVDDYAYLVVQNRSSLSALKSFEEMSMTDYSSLSGFLRTFGEAFFNGEAIDLMSFENKWLSLYGEGTALAIEYVPYLLHILFACQHNAVLGGTIRLTKQKDQLKKMGLPKLYIAVINALK